MTVVPLPATETSLGKRVVCVLTTPPASPSEPTLAELNAGLFGQCHIYGNLAVQPTQNTGEGPTKLCSKDAETRLGRVTWPPLEVQYSYIPQDLGTPGADGNELYEALAPDSEVYVYIADGLDGEATGQFASGDVVNFGFLCDVGEYGDGGSTGDGEFDEFSTTQQLARKGGRLLHNYVAPAA